MRVVLTGATGFVGGAMLGALSGMDVAVIGRSKPSGFDGPFLLSEIAVGCKFTEILAGADVLIHCAARAHIMNDSAVDPLEEFRKVNTEGTLTLARQAAAVGVKRFIFISTAKVNGESTTADLPFKPDDDFVPTDPYALSKFEAEDGLREIALKTPLEVVIVRPPLVYGPGVKANFAAMIRWVEKGVPLPLGGITGNRRSLVSLANLVDFIVVCLKHPDAANQTFLVSDGVDMSTADLLDRVAKALGVRSRVLPIPAVWIEFAAKLLRRPAVSQRLCGSLCVDISKARELLAWQPPYSVEQGLDATVVAYIRAQK